MSRKNGLLPLCVTIPHEQFHDHGLPVPGSISEVHILRCRMCGATNAASPGSAVIHRVSVEACLVAEAIQVYEGRA